jgi:hypothetical protein
MLPLILAPVEDRLQARIEQAEDAHVTEYTARCSKNCRHALRLSTGTFGCDARRWGATEQDATTCSDAKAQSCPGFSPPHTEDEIREKFRAMPETELGLRWPSINELLWIKRQVLAHLTAPPSDPAPAPTLPAAS